MKIKSLALVFLTYGCAAVASLAGVKATEARQSVESALQEEVTISTRPLSHDETPEGDRASLEMRHKRASEDWRRFLIAKTSDPAPDQGRRLAPNTRTFGELGYWRAFFDASVADDMMRIAEARTNSLARVRSALRRARVTVDLEDDVDERNRMLDLIGHAEKEIERWEKSPRDGASARAALKSILPQFIHAEAVK